MYFKCKRLNRFKKRIRGKPRMKKKLIIHYRIKYVYCSTVIVVNNELIHVYDKRNNRLRSRK